MELRAFVVGGTLLKKNQFQGISQLRGRTGNCSGVLIGPRVIITAAHCLSSSGQGYFKSGAFFVEKSPPNMPTFYGTNDFVPHPKAFPLTTEDLGSDLAYDYDFALAVLPEPINVPPITVNLKAKSSVGDFMTFVGTGSSNYKVERVFAYTKLVTQSAKSYTLRSRSSHGEHGDSGGALLKHYVEEGNKVKFELVGITSTGTLGYDYTDSWGPLAKPYTTAFSRLSIAKSFLLNFAQRNRVKICGVNLVCKPVYLK